MTLLLTSVKFFSRVGAEVTIDETYAAPLSWRNSRVQTQMRKQLFFLSTL